jgi:S-DNA-T family DNA segregation ATPase FtsK/SpoIIIE
VTKRNKRDSQRSHLVNILIQQILALLIVALGAISLLALFNVTRGRWAHAWVEMVRHWVGWGVYPVAFGILLGGLQWLQHQLGHTVKWRWRPLVGAELVFFSLLALTHAIAGRGDPWQLVEAGWGGGVVGWAIATTISTYLGDLITILALAILLVLGLGLTFDLTLSDIPQAIQRFQQYVAQYAQSHTHQIAESDQDRQPAPDNPHPAPPEEQRRASVQITSSPRGEAELPPLELLNPSQGPPLTDKEIREKSRIIKDTLAQFGVPVEVVEVRMGPTVTQFGVQPGFVDRPRAGERKVRVRQISSLSDDLALALATPRLRVEAPVPGRPFVGIEVPNSQIQVVGIREVMASEAFEALDSPLALTLGHDVAGDPVVADLIRMPHLLIAGTTGSGKSVCIKSFATCLVCNNTPEELRLVMIDPKMVELVRFNGLPHIYGEVEVDLDRVVKVLRWVALEMDSRYKRFAEVSARHLDDYNRQMKERDEPILPRIVVLIDELADLMMLAPEAVEHLLCRIAQMGRATGIHLVVATQRPSTDVVTGLIKANFPARVSFATASQVDSRVILDMPGAETLLGDGDMLYLAPDAGYPQRVQGCYVSGEEIDHVVGFWRKEIGPSKQDAPWAPMMQTVEHPAVEDNYVEDEMLNKAIALVRERGRASASLLQRRLHIGHPRAARLIEVLADMEVIGPPVGGGRAREVLIADEEESENENDENNRQRKDVAYTPSSPLS